MTNFPSKFCATSEMFESNFEFANQSFRVGDSMEWVMEKLLMTELWQKGSFLIDVNKECFKQSFSLSMGTENKKKNWAVLKLWFHFQQSFRKLKKIFLCWLFHIFKWWRDFRTSPNKIYHRKKLSAWKLFILRRNFIPLHISRPRSSPKIPQNSSRLLNSSEFPAQTPRFIVLRPTRFQF